MQWKCSSNNSDYYFNADANKNPWDVISDLRCVAQWSANQLNVNYYCDNDMTQLQRQDTPDYDNSYTTQSNSICSKTGYDFNVWLDEAGNSYPINTNIEHIQKSMNLRPNWQPKRYTVNFDTGGACFGYKVCKSGFVSCSGFENQCEIAYDAENIAFVSANEVVDTNCGLDVYNPVKHGYTFNGWKCGNITFGPNNTNIDKWQYDMNLNCVAQWIPNTINITWLDANGNQYGNKTSCDYNTTPLTVPTQAPDKEGYTFVGWITQPESQGYTTLSLLQ